MSAHSFDVVQSCGWQVGSMIRLLKNDADIKNPPIPHLECMNGSDCQFLTHKTHYEYTYQFFVLFSFLFISGTMLFCSLPCLTICFVFYFFNKVIIVNLICKSQTYKHDNNNNKRKHIMLYYFLIYKYNFFCWLIK